jgi:ADP-ribose pyrophosphatase YjhB (NUDIX family)
MPHPHQALLAELALIQPHDTLAHQHLQATQDWVLSGAPLYRLAKPATPPVHLVSYFVVTQGDQLLLVDHKNAGLWLPTGGHVEPGEHPRHTVVRELAEELGVALPQARVGPPLLVSWSTTVGRTAGHTDVSIWYAVPLPPGTPLRFDDTEFNAIAWFAPGDVPLQQTDPHLGRFLAALAGQAAPHTTAG